MRFFFMTTVKVLIVIMPCLLFLRSPELEAADWHLIVDMKGQWQFTVGDDPAWADPKTDTGDWDHLNVPGNWENQSYQGYNGYAWYRLTFAVRTMPASDYVTLFLGRIDDVDEVYINGRKIGQTGDFFPHYQSAFDTERRYRVPVSLLMKTGNVIAVRVYDEAGEGGMVRGGRFGLYDDRELALLSINLSGMWKFSTYDEGDMNSPALDDSSWKEIYVPATWESQGYKYYNGVAYYRKYFTAPASLQGQVLYLVLGKIDDFDKVFLNGKMIGRVEEMKQYSRFRRGDAYRIFRIYRLPERLIRSENLISVEVNDTHGQGGIYEGPVGVVTYEAARRLADRHREGRNDSWNFSFWDLIHLFD